MSEWQPIETAPKDGTIILAYCPEHGNYHKAGFTFCSWHDDTRGPGISGSIQRSGWEARVCNDVVIDEGWDTGHGFTLEVEPTHWMPMPEPPI